MAHTGGSKSMATLMNEQAIDGIEPTRAKIYILTHTKCRDGRPLDEESSSAFDEEMTLKRKNQEMLILELSWMRQVMWKYASTELSRPLNNESTTRQWEWVLSRPFIGWKFR
uniref:Uncharacterized protein n=1 Tax=Solanum lycopersicum TaxID=4081 RepID=A0A3Q7GIY2_SOLLC